MPATKVSIRKHFVQLVHSSVCAVNHGPWLKLDENFSCLKILKWKNRIKLFTRCRMTERRSNALYFLKVPQTHCRVQKTKMKVRRKRGEKDGKTLDKTLNKTFEKRRLQEMTARLKKVGNLKQVIILKAEQSSSQKARP